MMAWTKKVVYIPQVCGENVKDIKETVSTDPVDWM